MKYQISILLFFISWISNAQEITHLDNVLTQLNLEQQKCKLDLIVSKPIPNNTKETILVIPEIVTEDDSYYEFNSHIVIIDTDTGEIKSKYFESSKTNNWVSDAIRLAQIKIDTAPYYIAENERAFGIRVYYYNNSQPNPYTYESFSLFKKDGTKLKQLLNNFTIMEYSGETDTSCYGEFLTEKKVLILSKNKTNEYFNIIVKNKITTTKSYVDENGQCVDEENTIIKKSTLTYDTKKYN